jgi:transcriptional regulator with XRE-family HTH domain
MMTREQFRDTLSLLEMTQAEFARHLGLGRRTVVGYANGEPIPVPVMILTRLLLGGAVSVRDVDGVRQA